MPHLQLLEARYGLMIRVLVDIEEKRDAVTEWVAKVCPGVHLHFVPMYTDLMLSRAGAELDKIAARFNINGIIIATEPLSHKSYTLWALDHGYHIMMDKPITTRVDTGTNVSEAKGIADDYYEILAAYQNSRFDKRPDSWLAVTAALILLRNELITISERSWSELVVL